MSLYKKLYNVNKGFQFNLIWVYWYAIFTTPPPNSVGHLFPEHSQTVADIQK